MPRSRLFVAPLATALVTMLAACAPDESTAPEIRAGQVSSVPTATRAAASGGGALLVTEYGSPFTIVTSDPQRLLTSTLGATVAQIQAECTNATPVIGDPFTYRTLTTPSGKVLEHAQAKNVTVVVWAGYFEFGDDFCKFVANRPPLAVGTADYVLTSNNYFSPGAPGAYEDNVRAQGTVTNVQTGKLFHYVVRAGSLVTGGGTNKGYNNNIQLTPIKP